MIKQGDVVSTSMHKRQIKLGKPLSRGGQAVVFLVDGQPWVVKIYHHWLLTGARRDEQLCRLTTMARNGAPSPVFVWPLDVIERPGLGYVMPRLSSRYVSLLKFNWNADNTNWLVRLRMCYRLASALAALHLREGYAYCDLSGANVFCDPLSGAIRIIDTDNLTVDGNANVLAIVGTPRYMAPELHSGVTQHPGIHTDLHSLAVVMFETLLLHHPLLGDKVLEGPPELEDRALGARPVYIYHPRDKSNRYTKYREFGGLPPNMLPDGLQGLFSETFTHGAQNPQLRVRETRWRRALVDSLDILIPCTNSRCGFKWTFLNAKAGNCKCVWCGSPLKGFHVLKFFGRRGETLRRKVVTGTEWLAAHHCKLDELFNFSPDAACARIEKGQGHDLILRNVSKETFLYRAPSASSYAAFPPGKGIILRKGTRVQFGALGTEGEVVA